MADDTAGKPFFRPRFTDGAERITMRPDEADDLYRLIETYSLDWRRLAQAIFDYGEGIKEGCSVAEACEWVFKNSGEKK